MQSKDEGGQPGEPARIRHDQLLGGRPGGGHNLVHGVPGRAGLFERPGPDGRPAYVEFRVGDYQAELGIIDRRYAAPGAASEPGGAVMYWHVDDLAATVERLLSMGAKEYQPITPRGDAGFVTASVVDPFGNVLGVMYNPHYVDVLESIKQT
jgi:predicted enzyme related to lactoylglutathione lyase